VSVASDRENLVVAIGAVLLIVLFYGGGILGGNVGQPLAGMIAGVVVWLLALVPMVYTLREKREPLETSPFEDDQPEPVEEPVDEEPEPVAATAAEPSEPVEEYPPRRRGWRT
jgi:hypothetical protein